MADKATETQAPEVVAQEQKIVGDEAVQAEVHEVKPEVVNEDAARAVAQPREADGGSVRVHETVVRTDRVITDPSDPLAVQVPDAGRGDLSLPIHELDAPTVEQVFSSQAKSAPRQAKSDQPKSDRS